MMRSVLLAVVLLCSYASDGFGLVYVEKNGLFFYYPDDAGRIAERLIQKYPAMIEFLDQHGLPVQYPLHIILDEELDRPEVEVHMIPHREIRIPIRAPGVLEEGYREVDPWVYFLFKGLCLQGIYSIRSGLPGRLHRVFGEIISPNIIIPDWFAEGTCYLLHRLFEGKRDDDPLATAILHAGEPPDLAKTSHHPQIWPGVYSYRIYGRPFIRWVYQNYGWDRLLDFIKVHGRGIVPVEIDLKAKEVFGTSWPSLWNRFRRDLAYRDSPGQGRFIVGYWSDPFVYWNTSGVYPGVERLRDRRRYGYVDANNRLWLSEYDEEGVAKIVQYKRGIPLPLASEHVWDPGPGGIAVTRKGHRPALTRFLTNRRRSFRHGKTDKTQPGLILAPPGALQISGPVQDSRGRIAVAVSHAGNWDIWVYEGAWRRITRAPSIEMDPWWQDDRLVFASNLSGRFQIHGADMRQLTHCETAAILPREGTYLCLVQNGWQVMDGDFGQLSEGPGEVDQQDMPYKDSRGTTSQASPHNPLKSIWPNYWVPDLFISEDDLQVGAATNGRDVSRDYRADGGLRYSFDSDFLSWRLGGTAKDFGMRFTRYPLDYTTALDQRVDEGRNEFKATWMPFGIDEIELSANYRTFKPLETSGPRGDEFWGGLHAEKRYGDLWLWGNLEIYTEGSQSLFGGFRFLFGEQIYSAVHLQAGKSWGDVIPGHQTYRIGGNVVEGYFTQRPTRLFPLRGFDSNILDASQAVTAGMEIFWPLRNLQKGYGTLPLFLHRLRLGTFIDAGAASESLSWDDTLVGAGIELVTSLEIAWGNLSAFRVGVAWPIRQPEILDEAGPVILIQLGRPL
jgi:hypothetical protein